MDAIQCPICHEDIQLPRQAFLNDCFHAFCIDCIKLWTETQKLHPPVREQHNASFDPKCPLCKSGYSCIIYDCQDGAFRKLSVTDRVSNSSASDEYVLDPAQRRRRALYFTPAFHNRNLPFTVGATWQNLVRRPDVHRWLVRELQAIMLEADVNLVAQLISSMLATLPQEGEAWKQSIAKAAEPLLFDKSTRFAEELHGFISSGMSLTNHDRHTFQTASQGEVSTQRPEAERQEPPRAASPTAAASSDNTDSSRDSRSGSKGGIEASDSDGYLDLLMHQSRGVKRKHSGQ